MYGKLSLALVVQFLQVVVAGITDYELANRAHSLGIVFLSHVGEVILTTRAVPAIYIYIKYIQYIIALALLDTPPHSYCRFISY